MKWLERMHLGLIPSAAVVFALAGGGLLTGSVASGATAPMQQQIPGSFVPGIDDTLAYDEPGDGLVWARGRTYKASFGCEGTSYIPFLGSHAPRNFPVRFSIAALEAGGNALPVEQDSAPVRTGDAIEYHRGWLTERYDLALDGMEQSFHLASRPPVGDLRLVMEVETDLDVTADAGSLHFRSAWGGVDVAPAVAIDAHGRSISVASRSTGRGIEWLVPHDFLSSARYPVVIDPWISTFSLDVGYGLDANPDVAVYTYGQWWLVCWERVASATDSDIWSALYHSDGSFVPGTGMWTDLSSAYWSQPRVASIAHHFLVVAEVGDPSAGDRAIHGRLRDSASQQGPVQISGLEPGDKRAPVVGGCAISTPTFFLVVWEWKYTLSADHDILGRRVDTSGTPLGSGPFVIDDSLSDDTSPAVSRTNEGAAFVWNVVWEREYSSTDHDIYGARVAWDGAIVAPTFPIDTATEYDWRPCVSPSLDGLGSWAYEDEYLVAYQRSMPYFDSDIVATAMRHATPIAREDVSVLEGPYSSERQSEPSLDTDGRHFALVYAEISGSTGSQPDIRAADLCLSDGVLLVAEGHVALATSGYDEDSPRIACITRGATSTAGIPAMVVYAVRDLLGTVHDIGGAMYETTLGGPITPYCEGTSALCPCGNGGAAGHGCANSMNAAGGVLASSGGASWIADWFYISLLLLGSGMPPGSSCLYFQGTLQTGGGSGVPFGDGLRCVGGSVVRLGTLVNDATGSSRVPQSPGDAPLVTRGMIPIGGGTRYYQAWYRNAAAYCTASTFNLTNGLSVVWTW